MTSEITRQGRPEPRRRSWFAWREHLPASPRGDLVRLASSDRLIDAHDVIDRPLTGVVAVEDLCWQLALADWQKRKPWRWHASAYRSWCDEGQRIDDKRRRLVELTGEIRTIRVAG